MNIIGMGDFSLHSVRFRSGIWL